MKPSLEKPTNWLQTSNNLLSTYPFLTVGSGEKSEVRQKWRPLLCTHNPKKSALLSWCQLFVRKSSCSAGEIFWVDLNCVYPSLPILYDPIMKSLHNLNAARAQCRTQCSGQGGSWFRRCWSHVKDKSSLRGMPGSESEAFRLLQEKCFKVRSCSGRLISEITAG